MKGKRVRLGEVCEVNFGTRIRSKDSASDKYPVYGGGGKTFGWLTYNRENACVVSRFAMSEECVRWVDGKFFLNDSGLTVSSVSRDLDQHYLDRFLLGKQPEIYALGRGCAQRNLQIDDFKALQLPLPPLSAQRKIAEELDRICALKRAAEKVVEKLGVLAKAKFNEMFGDGKFEKRPLASCVKEMFIGPFGSALKNECFIMKDKSYCMVYEQKHAIRKSMDVDTRYVGKDKYEELKRFVVLPGDLIVSCRGTIGEIYRIPDDAPMGIMHPSIMKIRLDERLYDTTYFMQALSSCMKTESARANGSSVKMAITATALGMEMFILPPLPLQRQFAAYVGKVEKIEAAAKKVVEKLDVLYRAKLQEYFA